MRILLSSLLLMSLIAIIGCDQPAPLQSESESTAKAEVVETQPVATEEVVTEVPQVTSVSDTAIEAQATEVAEGLQESKSAVVDAALIDTGVNVNNISSDAVDANVANEMSNEASGDVSVSFEVSTSRKASFNASSETIGNLESKSNVSD